MFSVSLVVVTYTGFGLKWGISERKKEHAIRLVNLDVTQPLQIFQFPSSETYIWLPEQQLRLKKQKWLKMSSLGRLGSNSALQSHQSGVMVVVTGGGTDSCGKTKLTTVFHQFEKPRKIESWKCFHICYSWSYFMVGTNITPRCRHFPINTTLIRSTEPRFSIPSL